MTYTDIKELIKMTDRDSVQAFIDGDVTDANYAIYTVEDATQAVYDMFERNEYVLGMFNPPFVEKYICLDAETIAVLQESDAYGGIGKAIMDSGNFKDMMDALIDADGFGYVLGAYDGNHEEYKDLIIVRIK